jgi:K+-sensing histidine kinase KdpD
MTSGTRPDFTDRAQLIAEAHAPDAIPSPAGRGKLRTYLGIAPGVGKTYAMLRDARARQRSGCSAWWTSCISSWGSRRSISIRC